MNGWLKGIGILLIALCVIWAGLRLALIYKRRAAFWEQMSALCLFLESEIRYTADCPSNIFLRFNWASAVWPSAVSFFDFEAILNKVVKDLGLNEKEQGWLRSFYRGLGTTDLEGQLAHCSSYARMFEQQAKQAQQQDTVKGRLCRSLSVLGALTLAVLLV